MRSLQTATWITNAFCSGYLASFGLSFCIHQIGTIWVSECEAGTFIYLGGGGLVAKSYPTLCNPMAYCLLGSSVNEILHARILEWVATSYSRGSSRPMIEPTPLMSSALAGTFFTTSTT